MHRKRLNLRRRRCARTPSTPLFLLCLASAPACDSKDEAPAKEAGTAKSDGPTTPPREVPTRVADPSPASPVAEPSTAKFDPFANSNGDALPPDYTGPRYTLNHAYPSEPPPAPATPPWRAALKGEPISADNAVAYVEALKDYIADQGIATLVNDYTAWDPEAAHWYAAPWIANKVPTPKESWPGREPIQGSYPGPGFDQRTYPTLKGAMQDYVAVYYDPTAAVTLGQTFTPDPMNPKPGAQFHEGAIIVKLALTTASPEQWPVMKGSTQSKVFVPPSAETSASTGPKAPVLTDVWALQFDLIVKDAVTAPKTGWVFATLVYDRDAKGDTTWDKMVPLGAMWGNDPEINSAKDPSAPLAETVVNPAAPAYAKITLGWGGRLSGPNDAARLAGKDGERISSCMSCHGTAEYSRGPSTGLADLVPPKDEPGSDTWMQWFQDRPGTQPQTPGDTALDYDMVLRQALLNYETLTSKPGASDRFAAHMTALLRRGK